jgi:archaellum component FlaC
MSSYRIKNEIAVIKMALDTIEDINERSDRLQDIEDKIEQLEKENAMMREVLTTIRDYANDIDSVALAEGFRRKAREVLAKINKGE